MNEFLLSDFDAQFCREYIIDFDRSAAYRRAGGKAKNARQAAYEILTKPDVQNYVEELKKQRAEETGITAAQVLNILADMVAADPADILDAEGRIKDFHDWPVAWRRMLNGFDVEELFEGRSEDRKHVGRLKKIKLVKREKIIELLGKHVDVNAFQENIKHSGTVNMAERIQRGRRRAGK